MHLILDHALFLGSVDSGGYLVLACFQRWVLILGHFADVSFL